MQGVDAVPDVAMSTPASYGDRPLPKRNGTKTLLPGSWVGRQIKIEYTGADGLANSTSGVLLDLYPFGLIANVGGARRAVAWDSLALVELVDD